MEGATLLKERTGRPTVVVIGNEKGGTGKSTTAIHLAIALLYKGYRVATLDLDCRQKTFTRYIENRRNYAARTGQLLPVPYHHTTDPLEGADTSATVVARARLASILRMTEGYDYLILDTPGSASALSRASHEVADILITPMNDSLVDIDVLAHVDWDRREVRKPSVYCQFVRECRTQRPASEGHRFQWVVVRNRLAHLESRNMRDIDGLVKLLAENIGFQSVRGFGERVVYRELFANGLTVLDFPEPQDGSVSTAPPSHRAARAEVLSLLDAICTREPATV